MTQDEALKLALEALKIECRMYEATDPETGAPYNMIEAITAIKEALAQPDPYKQGYTDAMNWKVQNHLEHLPTAKPEQEPVAWATQMGEYAHIKWGAKRPEYPMVYEIPLYTTPPQRKPMTREQAYEMGAKGGEPSEAERLLFEAWMRGHCWAVIGEWNGKTYVHPQESTRFVNPSAMNTRQLWAAWRDRAALEAAHNIKENT